MAKLLKSQHNFIWNKTVLAHYGRKKNMEDFNFLHCLESQTEGKESPHPTIPENTVQLRH
jgi:hypothetical protein